MERVPRIEKSHGNAEHVEEPPTEEERVVRNAAFIKSARATKKILDILPEKIPHEEILSSYRAVIRDAVAMRAQGKSAELIAILLHEKYNVKEYNHFPTAYMLLFNWAARREKPPPPEDVAFTLDLLRRKEEGEIGQEEVERSVLAMARKRKMEMVYNNK